MPIEEGIYFPTQKEDEKVFLLIRKHWFVYSVFFFLMILMILPIIIIIIFWLYYPASINLQVGDMIIVGMSIYLLLMLSFLLFGFIDYYLDVDIVTDHRIVDIDQNGLFKRQISELHLRQIQDVHAKVEGFASTFFHFGDVYIQTAGEKNYFVFRSIPHPYTVAKQIISLHEQQIEMDEKGISSNREMEIDELEKKARKLLKQSTTLEKLKNPGPFLSPAATKEKIQDDEVVPIKKITKLNKSISKPLNFRSDEEEGELKEGREIDFK